MAYNTNNPVGSTDPRDLYDNAENLDLAMNGTSPTWVDRLGATRKSLAGITQDANATLAGLGYVIKGDYVAGMVLNKYNDVFRRNGEFYRAAAALSLPYTLTGDWATEGGGFVGVGDAVLRQELAAEGGAALVNMRYVDQISQWGNLTTEPTTNRFSNVCFLGFSDTQAADTVLSVHAADGTGSGYAFHALDYGTSEQFGGAIGAASSRSGVADAIVANRRHGGVGNGITATRWEAGDGHGVMGARAGSGAGHGVFATKVATSIGHAIYAENGSTNGDAIRAVRKLDGGPGHALFAHAEGRWNPGASVFAQKVGVDTGNSIESVTEAAGAAIRARAEAGAGAALHVTSSATSTADNTGVVSRAAPTGVALFTHCSPAAGARTGVLVANMASILPGGVSTGTAAVIAQDASLTANVQGAATSYGVRSVNTAGAGTAGYGVSGLANGAGNTTNYGVYGNAAGGTTNWSGYFVGNVFHGGTLTPSDERLKENIQTIDYQAAFNNVLACDVYTYEKYAAYIDPDDQSEKRQLVSAYEVGPLAQELADQTPEHVTGYAVGETEYKAVSDRSELYQLKAAVRYMALRLRELGVEI